MFGHITSPIRLNKKKVSDKKLDSERVPKCSDRNYYTHTANSAIKQSLQRRLNIQLQKNLREDANSAYFQINQKALESNYNSQRKQNSLNSKRNSNEQKQLNVLLENSSLDNGSYKQQQMYIFDTSLSIDLNES